MRTRMVSTAITAIIASVGVVSIASGPAEAEDCVGTTEVENHTYSSYGGTLTVVDYKLNSCDAADLVEEMKRTENVDDLLTGLTSAIPGVSWATSTVSAIIEFNQAEIERVEEDGTGVILQKSNGMITSANAQ